MAKESYSPPTYGTVHGVEARQRDAGEGVFAKNAGNAPANKARKAAPEDKASDSMTKAELLALAKRRGVDVETDDNKADLIRKINGA